MASFLKKISDGIKNVFKGVKKVFKKAGKEVKRFVKSDAFKVIVIAAAIWFGGAAIGLWKTGFAVDGALVASAQTGASAGATTAVGAEVGMQTGLGVSNAAGGAKAATSMVGTLAPETATGLAGVGTGAKIGAAGGLGANVAGWAPMATAPAVSGAASTGLTAGGVVKGAAGWMAANPIPTMIAGQTLAGAFSPNELDLAEATNNYNIEAERRAQADIDAANARFEGVGNIPTWQYSGATLPGVPGPRLPPPPTPQVTPPTVNPTNGLMRRTA